MSKVVFEFDGDEKFDIALCAQRRDIAKILNGISDYIRQLNKYEDRENLPTIEVENMLDEIMAGWYSIEDLEE